MAEDDSNGGGGSGGLGGADVVGGAVVTIAGDVTDLVAKEAQAKASAERIDALKATVRITGDDSELLRIVGNPDRLTGGAKGLVLTPRLDEAAVLRQSQALLDKVRDQWAGLVITPRVAMPAGGPGLPAGPGGATFTSAAAAGGATLPSGGHGPGGGLVSTATPAAPAAWAAPTPAPSQAARPYYPPAPRTHVPREFTRRGIEQTLVGAYHDQGGGFTAHDEERLNEAAGAGDPWTFQGELPAEVKEFLERDDLPKPARRKLRNLFRVTQTAGRGGGADAMGELGQDEYFRIAEQVGGSDARAAVAHAAASDDPELQYLANLHANLPRPTAAGQARRLRRKADAADDPAQRRSMLERAGRLDRRAADEAEELESLPAGKLEAGQVFTAFGREHRVDRDEDDELRLTNDEGLDVPVAGLRHVVADAGSLRRHEALGGSADPWDLGGEGDGGGGEPPAVVAAAPPPPPSGPARRPRQGRADGDEDHLMRRVAGRRAQLADFAVEASAEAVATRRAREAEIGRAQPRTGVEDAVGRLVDGLFTPEARPVDHGPNHGPRLANGDFRAARSEREQYAVGEHRRRAVAAGADGERFDQQVDERVGQGAGRAGAAREVEAEYRRAAAAAKKEADAGERAAAAQEKAAAAAEAKAAKTDQRELDRADKAGAAAKDRADRDRVKGAEQEQRVAERATAQQEREAKRLSAAELDHRLAGATPREQVGILREQAESHPDGSAERLRFDARATRLDRRIDEMESSDDGEGGGDGGRGRRRTGPLSFAGLARHLGGGILAFEALRLGGDALQYDQASVTAGNNARGQLAAQQGMIQGIEGIPLIGQVAGLVAEGVTGSSVKTALAIAGADATDASAAHMVQSDDFAHGQAAQHAATMAPGAAARETVESKYRLRQREQQITENYRTGTADIDTKEQNEAEAEVVKQTNAGWRLTHPTEFMDAVANARQGLDAGYDPLRRKLKADADRQRGEAVTDAAHEQNLAHAEEGAARGDAKAQATFNTEQMGVATSAGNRDTAATYTAGRAAERKLGLQQLNNQIGVAAVANDQPQLKSLTEARTSMYGTADPDTGEYHGGLFDAQTSAALKQMGLQSAVRVGDYQARGTSADQLAAGQRERAGLTMRTQSLVDEAKLLPSADATSPEAMEERAAGLASINKQLSAEKSMLTGHHGGAVVAGEDRGRAGAELLAGRIHATEDKQEATDVDAAIAKVNGVASPPGSPPAAAGVHGVAADPRRAAANAAQSATGGAFRELQAASAKLRARPRDKAAQAAVKAARAKYDAAQHEVRQEHAPHNGHAAPAYGYAAATELGDGKKNADGTTSVHATSARGMSAVLTPEMAENLWKATADRTRGLTPAQRDKLAHDEAHGTVATVTPTAAAAHAPSRYGFTAAVELGDQRKNAGGTVSVHSGAAGISAVLPADMAANLKRATDERYGGLTPKQRDQVARDEAHGKVTTTDHPTTAPPTPQMRAARAAAERGLRVTGDGAGRIVGDRGHAAAYGGGSMTAHSTGGGGDGSQLLAAKIDVTNRLLGDFLSRTSHSPAMARGV